MADFTQFIDTLSSTTGLDRNVVAAWVSREQGVNNNVLGLTSNGTLLKFQSQKQGAEVTAMALLTSPYYKGIIASVGKSPSEQAYAIASSPWHLGPQGLKQAGGVDPYYAKGFIEAGLLGGTPQHPTLTNGSSPTSGGTSGGGGSGSGGSSTNFFGLDLASPAYFIGIVLIGIAFLILGGFLSLKNHMPNVVPVPV